MFRASSPSVSCPWVRQVASGERTFLIAELLTYGTLFQRSRGFCVYSDIINNPAELLTSAAALCVCLHVCSIFNYSCCNIFYCCTWTNFPCLLLQHGFLSPSERAGFLKEVQNISMHKPLDQNQLRDREFCPPRSQTASLFIQDRGGWSLASGEKE